MQVSKIMLAVAALTIGASAIAAPAAGRVAISSGASATKGNLKNALINLCERTGGTATGALNGNKLTEFASGSNISTYVCADATVTGGAGSTYVSKADAAFKNFFGTDFAELRLNVTGGSFTAICALNFIGQTSWAAGGTACANVNTSGAADLYRDPATLTNVLPAAGQVVVGGLMDVEPAAWPETVRAGLTVPGTILNSGVAQTFGVAASNALYSKLFAAQLSDGAATVAKPIPSSCAETDYSNLECIPTISKAQMATLMNPVDTNAAYTTGVQFLTGDEADAELELQYNRRADTSGTQAAAQAYFLGLPCSSSPLAVVDQGVAGGTLLDGTFLRVFGHAGTGNVRAQLNTANYGIGIMSGENNQATGVADSSNGTTTWKWLRVQGAAMGEAAAPGTAGITNKESVKNGSYDFYFESKVAPGTAAGSTTFWNKVTGALKTLSAPVGLLNSADLATFAKGGSACQGSVGQ